jgi:hypothetical protein
VPARSFRRPLHRAVPRWERRQLRWPTRLAERSGRVGVIAGGYNDAVTAFTSVAAHKFASLLPTGEGFVVPLLRTGLPRTRGDQAIG